MTSLILSRGNFVAPGGGHAGPSVAAKELAEKLETLFDYSGHKEKVTYESITAKLREIGYPPFTRGSIRRYKRMMEAKATGLWYMIGGWTALVANVTGFISYCVAAKSPSIVIIVPWLALGVVNLLAALGFTFAFGENEATWQSLHVQGYTGVLPDDAARAMLKIHEAFPTASFSVEELRVGRRERVVHDPFLVVLIDKYLFHVVVWNEPEYVPVLRTR